MKGAPLPPIVGQTPPWCCTTCKIASLEIVTIALRDFAYSATPEAQAASLANIDDFLDYAMNHDDVVEMLRANEVSTVCQAG